MRLTRATLDPRRACGAAQGLRDALAALRVEHQELTLVGPEPTLEPSLVDWVGLARAAGFARVGVRSTASALAEPALTARLCAAGLTDLLVPLHGPTAACHDYHVDCTGAFAATRAGLDAARAASLVLGATTTITRSNFRALGELAALLARLGVAAWQLVVPSGLEPSSEAFARLVPRFALALPYALHAIEQARELGIAARLRAAPLCRLGRYASVSLPTQPRRFGRPCQACAARAQCSGVDPAYLCAYGAKELRALPCTAAPHAPLGEAEALLVAEEGDLGWRAEGRVVA